MEPVLGYRIMEYEMIEKIMIILLLWKSNQKSNGRKSNHWKSNWKSNEKSKFNKLKVSFTVDIAHFNF